MVRLAEKPASKRAAKPASKVASKRASKVASKRAPKAASKGSASVSVPLEAARRLFLGAQGLLANPEKKLGPAKLIELVEALGFVQIDSINVVDRAHHLTLRSRADQYRREHLAKLLEETRELFEHWTHDASAIPTAWYPHWHHRFEPAAKRIRASAWWTRRMGGAESERTLDRVRGRIEAEGPLFAQDFESTTRGGEENGWWSWTPEKAALEFLWHTGVLAVTRRVHFQKQYDLAERVIPEAHRAHRPTREEHVDWACRTALERLGVATPGELAAFWRAISIPEAKSWCVAKVAAGEVVEVALEGESGPRGRGGVYALSSWAVTLDGLPEPPDRVRLLSPFDPVVRDRARCERLFGFDFRFEAFVPGPKRAYGYYVLPILEGDRFVGRAEPKHLRDEETLELRGLWWEPGVKPTAKRRAALDEELERLAAFVGAKDIRRPR